MYDPRIVEPMRMELTSCGAIELRTAEEVDQALKSVSEPTLVVINSVCGCAAGAARPAVKLALESERKPVHIYTVFAGQDREATERARSYLHGYPPSSPSMALLKNGEVVKMISRQDIEGYSAVEIADKLKAAFIDHC